MHSSPTSTGKRLLQQRKGVSWAGATYVLPHVVHRSVVTEWRTTQCALPAALSSLSGPAYSVPSSIASKADFEHQYRQHMETPNIYCRYGDIELYAPSEEGAAAILKTVAEPLIRCQRWLRLGHSLIHIILYEMLKMFSALGGDRELILAASEELDGLATLKAGSTDAHMPMNTNPNGGTYSPGEDSGSSKGNGIVRGLDNGLDQRNGFGHSTSSFNGNGTSHMQPHAVFYSHDNGSSNGNSCSSIKGDRRDDHNGEHSGSSNRNSCGLQLSRERSTHSPSLSTSSLPSPGFLLLRTASRERGSAQSDPTSSGLLDAFASGTASPLLLVEMHDDCEGGSSSGIRGRSSSGGGGGGGGSRDCALRLEDDEAAAVAAVTQTGATATVTAAKYRLWARMMEAALHSKESVPLYGNGHNSRRRRVHVATLESQGINGTNAGDSLVEEARPVIVWGLLTDMKCWRFYCLRETTRHGSTYGNSSNGVSGDGNNSRGGSPKFEILGSRRLRVADESMTTWPGLVPALAALYAILCTADGLAVRRAGDALQALTYEMPHDPHRDRLMRLHLIMGAPNTPLYGALGEWVRQRLDEYIQCRHDQKQLRQAAESAAQKAGAGVAVARAAASAAAAATLATAGGTQQTTSAAAAVVSIPKAITAAPLVSESAPAEEAVARVEAAQASRASAVAGACAGAAAASPGGPASRESGQHDLGDDAEGEEGVGGLPAVVAAATETTEYYEGRLAVAMQRLAAARERASRLRLHARMLGLTCPLTNGDGSPQGLNGT